MSSGTDEQQERKRVFVLLGGHRSGTSLAARAFEALGLPLDDDLIPGHADNPEGFWEHRGILEHTRAIEQELEVNPLHGSRLLPPGGHWWEDPACGHHIEALAEILAGEVEHHGVFGFKDPRTLLLLPLWQEVFRRAGVEPVYVFLVRHPGAVAASYAKRQKLESDFGEYVWLLHWSHAIGHLHGPPAAVIHFEHWFGDPTAQIEKARQLLEQSGLNVDDDAVERVHSFLRPELSHHKATDPREGLKADTIRLYDILCEGDITPEAWSRARSVATGVLRQHEVIAPAYRTIAERARRVDRQGRQKTERIEALQEKLRLVQEAGENRSDANPVERVDPRPPAPYEIEFPGLQRFIDEQEGPGRKLKVCIATEDIVGPIRNGGIGTTYFYLARMLAEAGHDTSIVYVRGDHCENESIQHWVDYYAGFGVRFLALDPGAQEMNSPAPRWIRPMVALYEHLKTEHYDLVHVSEWRGTGYIAQSAKALGLGFRDTLFCVKTSSPWLWNREHGFHTLAHVQDLPKIHAERRSVELADLVIGGSRHLLCWMYEHGYRLPHDRTYVQPNVMVPVDLDEIAAPRREHYGQRMAVDEIAFFGRLEYRKGLDVFCDAIDILLTRGVKLPNIHLLGKIGEVIPSYSEFTTDEYIKYRTEKWPMKVRVHTEFNTEEVLRFLLEGKRLAVMPSIIENSSLAVYETAYYAIPFIASDRGGTPELVAQGARDRVLTEPHPVPLAAKLDEALQKGGLIARPSFSNDRNLAIWRRFHAAAGAYLDAKHQTAATNGTAPSISVCLAVGDNHEHAGEVMARLERLTDAPEIVLADNGSLRPETRNWLKRQAADKKRRVVVERLEAWGEQHAQNRAAEVAGGELLVFVRDRSFFKPDYFEKLATAAAASDADVFCCHYEEVTEQQLQEGHDGTPIVLFADDLNYGFYDPDNVSPVLAVRREAFQRLGGFREDFKVPGAEAEFVAMANLQGVPVTTIPESLAWDVTNYPVTRRMNYKALPYRTIRPYLENAPQCYGRLLLLTRGSGAKLAGKGATSAAAAGGDPNAVVDAKARKLAGEMAGFGRFRALCWRIYNAQHRVFHRILDLEMRTLHLLVRIYRRLRRR